MTPSKQLNVPRGRRLVRFSLRTLLLAFIPLSAILAWISTHFLEGQRQQAVLTLMEDVGGEVYFADEKVDDHYERVGCSYVGCPDIGWRRRILGDAHARVIHVIILPQLPETETAAYLATVSRLSRLQSVCFTRRQMEMQCVQQFQKDRPSLTILRQQDELDEAKPEESEASTSENEKS